MQFHFAIFLFAFCLIHSILGAANNLGKKKLKILVYSPSVSFSHAQFLGKIADTLQGAGHEVHFLKFVAVDELRLKNETKLVKKVYLIGPKGEDVGNLDITKMDIIRDAFAGSWPTLSVFNHPMSQFSEMAAAICEQVISNGELLDQLEAEKFDVGIAEMYDLCPGAIFHRIGVRSIQAVFAIPFVQMIGRRFGIPTFASFVPNIIVPSMLPLHSSFFARLFNFYNEFYDWFSMGDERLHHLQEPLAQKYFGPNFPKLKEIVRNTSLIFVNSNPFFEMPRPISNKIIHIGGLVDKNGHKEHKLDEVGQSNCQFIIIFPHSSNMKRSRQILDNSGQGGAVLLSFGSIADTTKMPIQMRRAILRAFARFPSVQFLWKLDQNSRANDSALFSALPNVHIFDWIHQSAILKHPNLRVFITHCGQNSLTEASQAGVPVLGIPLFGDQRNNLLVAKHLGMALFLDVRDLGGPNGEEMLVEALEKILNEPKYKEKAQMIKKKLALSPFRPADKLIRWVEFAAEFPDLNELNMPGEEEMSWFIFYSIDAITFTLTIFGGLIWMGWRCARICLEMALAPRRRRHKLKGQ